MTERYHGLDAVRAGAMLMGLVIHGMLIYTEDWLFAELLPEATRAAPETQGWALTLTLWIHLWRIPLFMLLAGFFAQMVLERRGVAGFAADRGLRVLGTVLVFMTAFDWLTEQPWGTLDHLWFLWWLSLFCAIAALGHGVGLRPPALRLDRVRVAALTVPGIVALTSVGRIQGLEGRIPDTVFDWDTGGFVYHYALFLAGQMLWAGRHSLDHLARGRVWGAWLGFGTLAFLALLAVAADAERLARLGALPVSVLSGSVTLGFALGFVGLAHATLRSGGRILRLTTRLAYPVYVFHLYPVLVATALLHEAGLGSVATVALGAGVALGVSLAAYGLIWPTPLDWLFSGPRKSWWRWPLGPRMGKP